jgi:hypothetical protein
MPTEKTLLSVNSKLEIKISIPNSGKSFTVRLSRVFAQHLASALREYSGAEAKSFSRADRTSLPVDFLIEPPEPKRSDRPIRLDSKYRR